MKRISSVGAKFFCVWQITEKLRYKPSHFVIFNILVWGGCENFYILIYLLESKFYASQKYFTITKISDTGNHLIKHTWFKVIDKCCRKFRGSLFCDSVARIFYCGCIRDTVCANASVFVQARLITHGLLTRLFFSLVVAFYFLLFHFSDRWLHWDKRKRLCLDMWVSGIGSRAMNSPFCGLFQDRATRVPSTG